MNRVGSSADFGVLTVRWMSLGQEDVESTDMRATLVIVLLMVVAVLGVLLVQYGRDFLEVDRCLDSGGRWNANQGLCECRDADQSESRGKKTCYQ